MDHVTRQQALDMTSLGSHLTYTIFVDRRPMHTRSVTYFDAECLDFAFVVDMDHNTCTQPIKEPIRLCVENREQLLIGRLSGRKEGGLALAAFG